MSYIHSDDGDGQRLAVSGSVSVRAKCRTYTVAFKMDKGLQCQVVFV